MPELPDITVYVERLASLAQGAPLTALRVVNPFFLRTVEPPTSDFVGHQLVAVSRLGKRVVMHFDGDRYAVIHLMIAGRLRWTAKAAAEKFRRIALAYFEFADKALTVTEAGAKRRASLHLVAGSANLLPFDRGGLDIKKATPAEFAARVHLRRHTIKRALTDPALFDGVGNAYSDEILHRARLSPFRLTTSLAESELARLHAAAIATMDEWIERLRNEAGAGFPEKVTAFRTEMAVHGKYGQPCPTCGATVQRIVYAANEANYCAQCQTDGKLLADRSLSRLLKADWPRSLEELEERRATTSGSAAVPTRARSRNAKK